MPKLDGTGPDGQGAKSGRRLGECSSLDDAEKLAKLGNGMGKKRKAGCGEGQGKRLRTDEK
ncbi:MAG: DUF5320 domain-containing protein [Bacteroidales bacterium]|nr:DUF5320 domain-containing protein [Bacteroidales bacterium]MDY0254649.1 DUF5320 domain-containing protein [Tenuifilaceae bacterium]